MISSSVADPLSDAEDNGDDEDDDEDDDEYDDEDDDEDENKGDKFSIHSSMPGWRGECTRRGSRIPDSYKLVRPAMKGVHWH